MAKKAGLNGYWTGAYAYGVPFPSVPFNAHLEQSGAAVTGTITEPDTLNVFKVVIALSTLAGHREGDHLHFRKTMQNGQPGHVIIYNGTVNGDETRIDGHWTIPGAGSGAFSMQRDHDAKALAVEPAETVRA